MLPRLDSRSPMWEITFPTRSLNIIYCCLCQRDISFGWNSGYFTLLVLEGRQRVCWGILSVIFVLYDKYQLVVKYEKEIWLSSLWHLPSPSTRFVVLHPSSEQPQISSHNRFSSSHTEIQRNNLPQNKLKSICSFLSVWWSQKPYKVPRGNDVMTAWLSSLVKR